MQASKPIGSSLDCLSEVEAVFGSQLLNMDFGQRELNAEVCLLLDAVRKEQSCIEEKLPSLWRELFRKLRKRDSSIPDSERKLATSLVFGSAAVILSCSKDVFYSFELASCVHDADEQNNPDGCEERISMVLDALEPYEDELTGWIELFMAETDLEAEGEIVDLQMHPLSQYVQLADKAESFIGCLRQLVNGATKQAKKQLAPIKAAIDYSPRLISNDVTYEVIKEEFGIAFSEESFKNWIKGNRGNKYEEDELQPFWEIFDDQIMHKNVNSGL